MLYQILFDFGSVLPTSFASFQNPFFQHIVILTFKITKNFVHQPPFFYEKENPLDQPTMQ